MSQKPKYHKIYELTRQDPTIDNPTELHIELGNPDFLRDEEGNPIIPTESLIAGIDKSIVNGLRRILLSEVKTRGFAKNIQVPETFLDTNDIIQRGNLTIFNSEHISDRIGMVPIHDYVTLSEGSSEGSLEGSSEGTEGTESTGKYVVPQSLLADEKNWVFRICDSVDPNLPLKHMDDGDVYNRQRFVKVKDIRVFHRSAIATSNSGNDATASSPNTTDNNSKPSTNVVASPDSSGTAGNANNNNNNNNNNTVITHSKEKIAQVSSRINYILLGTGGWVEMDENFKKKIFKYPELILLSLKKGEGVFAEMSVETGYGGVIAPNAMLPPANSAARWISAIPDYRFKMDKEFVGTYNKATKTFTPTYNHKEQIANALKNFELDRKLAPVLSRIKINTIVLGKVKEYQENIDESGFFPDEKELDEQKKMLEDKVVLLEKEIKVDETKKAELEAQKMPAELSNDPVEDQKNYLRAYDPILNRYGNPERFMIDITYNGHLWPQDVWIYAIQTMIEKIRKFKIILNSIQDVSGRISERALVKFDVNIPEKIEITIDDKIDIESHTLGNLIKSHYVYLLDHIINNLYPDKYVEVWSSCFSNYKVPHPLKTELIMTFQTPGEEYPLFPDTGRYTDFGFTRDSGTSGVTGTSSGTSGRSDDNDEDTDDKVEGRTRKAVKAGKTGGRGLFSNLYDRETNETLRLLKITCDVLLEKLDDVLEDAKLAAVIATTSKN